MFRKLTAIEPVSLERYDYIQLPAADTWGF